MVWHYNAFLSYDVQPVEETRIEVDEETARNTQVEWNAFFLENGLPGSGHTEKGQLRDSLYANAAAEWSEPVMVEKAILDRRA